MSGAYRKKAEAGWRGGLPEWVAALAHACDLGSQTAMARQLGVNDAYLSYAIRNVKPEYHARVEEAVRSRLMGEDVEGPVMGEIPVDVCGRNRRSRLRPLGPVQKALRQTCPTCIHNRKSEGGDDAE